MKNLPSAVHQVLDLVELLLQAEGNNWKGWMPRKQWEVEGQPLQAYCPPRPVIAP
jgi:hypothetical protein